MATAKFDAATRAVNTLQGNVADLVYAELLIKLAEIEARRDQAEAMRQFASAFSSKRFT